MHWLPLVVFLLSFFPVHAQEKLPCQKIQQLKFMLDTYHVSPRPWDDSLASEIIENVFHLVDPDQLYFNSDEKNLFSSYPKKLSEELLKGDCSFVTELLPVYKNALLRASSMVNTISISPLDFTVPDTLKLSLEQRFFAGSDSALRVHWTQRVKHSVLGQWVSLSETKGSISSEYKPLLEKACRRYQQGIKRRIEVEGGMEKYLFNKLLKAITMGYDPHTDYFSVDESQAFLDMISSDGYSFGIIMEDDPLGNVTIGRIIPGSSAWNAKSLHVGDIIETLKSPHLEQVDATLYSSEEIDEMMELVSREVEVTVRKVNGERQTVKLLKQKVRADENKIKSLVISDKQHLIGYVNLPVFYSKSELSQTGCATDLAKEIIQLKKANIQGLILDIRNNGGGDLEEAIDLAGLFVDRGALAIIKERNKDAETLNDPNLGVAYSGPLLIMVNGASASASELFAAAMQRHHRAMVVGTTTFGKATGQSVMPFVGGQGDLIKITSFRFYDITGATHQGEGVWPDINIPDLFDVFDYRESSLSHYLKPDKIKKKTYYTALPPLQLDLLRDSAENRIAKNPYFQDVEKRIRQSKSYYAGGKFLIPLTLKGYIEMIVRMNESVEGGTPVSDRYRIGLTKFDEQITHMDEYGQETYQQLFDQVAEDYTVMESLNILTNYIQLLKK